MDATEIIQRLGGVTAAAQRLGQKRTAVSMWIRTNKLPLRHVPAVAMALDVPACEIWPDLARCKQPPRPDGGKQLSMFPPSAARRERAA